MDINIKQIYEVSLSKKYRFARNNISVAWYCNVCKRDIRPKYWPLHLLSERLIG